MLRNLVFKLRFGGILIPIFLICSHQVCAQNDSLVIVGSTETPIAMSNVKKHSPHKATLYSAVLPGLGQAYNHKYWKIPILYGGIAASVYYISFNTKYYNMYKEAYRDFIIRDPANTSYEDIILERTRYTVDEVLKDPSMEQWFENALKNKKTYYKRNRDLSYILLIGVYVLNLIDASVDAHFFDYDVSDDLSLHVQPTMIPTNPSINASGSGGVGLQLTLNF